MISCLTFTPEEFDSFLEEILNEIKNILTC